MTKTEQTLEVIKKKCDQIGHGEWPIKLIIYDKEIVGFDQIDSPIVKFRVRSEKKLDK